MTLRTVFLLSIWMAIGLGQALPQEPARVRQTHGIGRTTVPIKVDGSLDEEAWQHATKIAIPYEWFPGDNTPAPVKTECLLLYDEENLYFGFRAHDPDPSKIRAKLADRDTAFQDDTVGFVLDTFNDGRRGYQFRINALGVQMEAVNSDVDQSEDWAWDAIWKSDGRITDWGYAVEVALPFKQLRFPRSSGPQTWRILAMRDYPRLVRHRLRSTYQDRDLDCFICQSETLSGLEGLKPGLNLELTPTLTGGRTDTRENFPDGPLVSGDEKEEAGASLRWSITPNTTLNAALNPDFSQVEADAAQLDVNERFALFFPEKRPFFLEGSDFFNTPMNVVFTRTVANPSAGVKLTGKEGKNAYGVFYTRDKINNLIFPGNQGSQFGSFKKDVDAGVLRYRRDIGATSTVGAIYTGREGENYHNRLFGIDGALRLGGADTIRFQALNASTRYPDQVADNFDQKRDSFNGAGINVEYTHNSRNWFWNAEIRDLERGFRADSGFMPRVDVRQGSLFIQRAVWGSPQKWFRRLEFEFGADVTEDQNGTRTDEGMDLGIQYFGPYQSFFSFTLSPNEEFFQGVTYDNLRQSIYFEVRPSGQFFIGLFTRWGETIDFANARQADLLSWQTFIELNLGRAFKAEIQHDRQELDVTGGRLFRADLTQTKLFYHFNRNTFIRGILQYTDITRDPSLYTFPIDAETESLFSQFLFSYKINPQTVALVGYSENALGDQNIDLTDRDRTIFVKLGYAWVF